VRVELSRQNDLATRNIAMSAKSTAVPAPAQVVVARAVALTRFRLRYPVLDEEDEGKCFSRLNYSTEPLSKDASAN